MAYVVWKQDYSVGVEIIDDQHKHFIDIFNRLYSIIQQGQTTSLDKIIEELVIYTKVHFDTEEKYFKEFNYEGASEHINAHKILTAKVGEFLERKNEDQLIVSFELLDFMENWLIDHLSVMDKKYTKCFKEHGL